MATGPFEFVIDYGSQHAQHYDTRPEMALYVPDTRVHNIAHIEQIDDKPHRVDEVKKHHCYQKKVEPVDQDIASEAVPLFVIDS